MTETQPRYYCTYAHPINSQNSQSQRPNSSEASGIFCDLKKKYYLEGDIGCVGPFDSDCPSPETVTIYWD